MNRQEIISQIKTKATFLCIGLDPDIQKIPSHLLKGEEPLFAFNKAIIDATHDLCVAYKPNLAFYESCGLEGWKAFEKTVRYIREKDPSQFIIADAKRGDIGNTAEMYARSFYESLAHRRRHPGFLIWVRTVFSLFLSYPGKWAILLALTSNRGSADFQMLEDAQGERLFEKVLRRSSDWGDESSMMYVVGATQGSLLQDVRKLVPRHFLLVPGVGTQGGSLKEVARYAMNDDCGLLVNVSRQILYASKDEEFAQAARQEALKLQQEMQTYLKALWG